MVSILFSDIHSIPHVVPAGSWVRLGAKGVIRKCCQGPTMCKVIPGAVMGTDKSEMGVPPTQRLGLEPGRKNQKTPERHGDQQRLLGAACVSRTRRRRTERARQSLETVARVQKAQEGGDGTPGRGYGMGTSSEARKAQRSHMAAPTQSGAGWTRGTSSCPNGETLP